PGLSSKSEQPGLAPPTLTGGSRGAEAIRRITGSRSMRRRAPIKSESLLAATSRRKRASSAARRRPCEKGSNSRSASSSPSLPDAEPEVRLALLLALAAGHDDEVVGPGPFGHQRRPFGLVASTHAPEGGCHDSIPFCTLVTLAS